MSPICHPVISPEGKKHYTIITKPPADKKHKFTNFLTYIRIDIVVIQQIFSGIM